MSEVGRFIGHLSSYPTLNVVFKMVDIELLFGNYKLEQITDGDNSDHFCIFDYGQMTHTLFGHQGHAQFDRLFRPDMDYISLHYVSDQRTRRRFAFENNVPRIVSLGYDTNQFFAVHHDERANIFLSHSCQSVEYCSVRINGPNVRALLFKQMFYSHARPLDFLSETFPAHFIFYRPIEWVTLI